jgi:NAD(P)-dependent dehydrogenase (short-subunit alcohol dehydrogenase family)
MEGKAGLVTGAASGIGRACAIRFAAEGAKVVVADLERARAGGEETVRAIRDAGGDAAFVACDVSRGEDCAAVVDAVVERFGRLDYAHNNAGIGVHKLLHETDDEDFDRVIAVNLRGTFLCSKFALEPMLAQGEGWIVNISSGAGKRGVATRTAYSAAKFGIVGFTDALDAEVRGQGVRVHVVCPGPVESRMRREGFPDEDPATLSRPEDVAEAVLFCLLQRPTAYTREVIVMPGHT